MVEDELKTFERVTAIGITGCGFEYEIDAGITDDKYIAVQYKCPIVEYGQAANLGEAAESVINWCSAARTYEAQAIDKNIKHTYTHCLGKGHKICRWVIEKQE